MELGREAGELTILTVVLLVGRGNVNVVVEASAKVGSMSWRSGCCPLSG